MAGHDIIAIGGSAGSLDALKTILGDLPADLPASLFVVTHRPSGIASHLHDVLALHSRLPIAEAEDGAPIRPGTVVVAPAGSHLLLVDGRMRLGLGPRENMARPAVDALFRSAALAYGPRIVGVVLSGMLDDGAAGLAAIRRCGGLAVVQDPVDAAFDEMPRSAIAAASIDHLAPARTMGALLARLAGEPAGSAVPPPPDLALEVEIATGGRSDGARIAEIADAVPMTCPDCGGVLAEVRGSKPLRYRCQTGHGYTARQLDQDKEEAVDEALRVALRIVDERVELVARMSLDAARSGRPAVAEMYRTRSEEYRGYAETIRRAVLLSMAGPS